MLKTGDQFRRRITATYGSVGWVALMWLGAKWLPAVFLAASLAAVTPVANADGWLAPIDRPTCLDREENWTAAALQPYVPDPCMSEFGPTDAEGLQIAISTPGRRERVGHKLPNVAGSGALQDVNMTEPASLKNISDMSQPSVSDNLDVSAAVILVVVLTSLVPVTRRKLTGRDR